MAKRNLFTTPQWCLDTTNLLPQGARSLAGAPPPRSALLHLMAQEQRLAVHQCASQASSRPLQLEAGPECFPPGRAQTEDSRRRVQRPENAEGGCSSTFLLTSAETAFPSSRSINSSSQRPSQGLGLSPPEIQGVCLHVAVVTGHRSGCLHSHCLDVGQTGIQSAASPCWECPAGMSLTLSAASVSSLVAVFQFSWFFCIPTNLKTPFLEGILWEAAKATLPWPTPLRVVLSQLVGAVS